VLVRVGVKVRAKLVLATDANLYQTRSRYAMTLKLHNMAGDTQCVVSSEKTCHIFPKIKTEGSV